MRPTILLLALVCLGSDPVLAQTFITPRAYGDAVQWPEGFWLPDDPGGDPVWYVPDGVRRILTGAPSTARIDSGARPGLRVARGQSPLAQYDAVKGRCAQGLAKFVEKTPTPQCSRYSWWAPASHCFNEQNTTARKVIEGRLIDRDRCDLTREPDRIEVAYRRFVGLSFAPFVPGRYVSLVGGPGIAELRLKLRWDYGRLTPSRVRLRVLQPVGHVLLEDAAVRGEWTFVSKDRSLGRYVFSAEILDSSGRRVHEDLAVADLTQR
jgi:hypothetical protein